MLTDAEILAAKFNYCFPKKGAITDAQIGAAFISEKRPKGITKQGVGSWRKTGRINKPHLRILAELSGKPVDWWIDGKLPTTEVIEPSSDIHPTPSTEKSYPSKKGEVMHLHVASRKATTDDDVFLIPRLDVKAKGGFGALAPANEFVIGSMSVTNSWIHQKLPKISAKSNLTVIEAYGRSMMPTLMSGDLMLVDMGVTEVKVEGIYILLRKNTSEPEIMVKRIQRKLDGGLIVRSDNRDEYDPEVVEAHEIHEKIQVVGKVVWVWAGREA